jgi:hypothetical protein
MAFQDMVMRATKGVLNYVADDLNEESVSGRVEQDQTSNGYSGVPLDVESSPAEHNSFVSGLSPVEAASSSFW